MAEIRVEDLWQHCETCNRTGRITERTGSFGVSQTMEMVCPDCKGARGRCTESGNAVLSFMIEMKRLGKFPA
jgi:hypothetical protein